MYVKLITFISIDPETGANTQLIESSWLSIKSALPDTYTRHSYLADHLPECMCRKHVAQRNEDFFMTLIQCNYQ